MRVVPVAQATSATGSVRLPPTQLYVSSHGKCTCYTFAYSRLKAGYDKRTANFHKLVNRRLRLEAKVETVDGLSQAEDSFELQARHPSSITSARSLEQLRAPFGAFCVIARFHGNCFLLTTSRFDRTIPSCSLVSVTRPEIADNIDKYKKSKLVNVRGSKQEGNKPSSSYLPRPFCHGSAVSGGTLRA